jgi:hypothetical protein
VLRRLDFTLSIETRLGRIIARFWHVLRNSTLNRNRSEAVKISHFTRHQACPRMFESGGEDRGPGCWQAVEITGIRLSPSFRTGVPSGSCGIQPTPSFRTRSGIQPTPSFRTRSGIQPTPSFRTRSGIQSTPSFRTRSGIQSFYNLDVPSARDYCPLCSTGILRNKPAPAGSNPGGRRPGRFFHTFPPGTLSIVIVLTRPPI